MRSNLGLINGFFGVDCVSVIVFFTVNVRVFLSISIFFSVLVVVLLSACYFFSKKL